jgi:uncharacterized coiled-coil protein SlyX
MPTQSPAQEIASRIATLESKVGDLQKSVRLTNTRDAVEDLQTEVKNLNQRLAGLRTRGYVFEKDLEPQAQAFVESWAMLSPNVQAQINSQSALLVNALRPIELQMPQLVAASSNPAAARGILNSLEAAVNQLENKVDATDRMISGMYDRFRDQVRTVSRHLDDVDYLLKNLAEATFKLLPTEAGIAAVKAVWCKTGKEQKEDPDGVLYLTDQRMLFEQKEEIATKKVLFIATEKQKVQNLQLEVPIALMDKVTTNKTGMMKNEDHVEISFQTGAPFQVVNFHIWQDCTFWQGLLNRAKTRDFDAGRAVALDQSTVDKVKAAPTQCPSCGGAITKPVLRGQDTIKCEYCGFEIRL